MKGKQVDVGGKRTSQAHYSIATLARPGMHLILLIQANAGIQLFGCHITAWHESTLDSGIRPNDSIRQMRLNTSVPLVPPKPKPFDTTTSTLASRAVFGT